MRFLVPCSALFLGFLSATSPAHAADPVVAPARAIGIGEAVTDVHAVDVDGVAFSLAGARVIPEADALSVVLAAAREFGGGDAKADTAIASLSGLSKDGSLDPARKTALVQTAWKRYGLIASDANTKDLLTLADVAKRIVDSASAPIVFFAWSSSCPTIALYADRLFDVFSTTGARVFPFACNAEETVASIRTAIGERKLPYRILLDPDAKLADLLGARTTPHMFVLDEQNFVRFNGAPDNDPAMVGDESKRTPYLKDALKSVVDGRQVEIRMTNPKGCRIRRKKA